MNLLEKLSVSWFNKYDHVLLYLQWGILTLLCLSSCKPRPHVIEGLDSEWPIIEYPIDNGADEIKAQLGFDLFHDPNLSIDSSVSCASCHLASHAFSDTVAFSTGVYGQKGIRNSPTLLNIAYAPYFMREGGVPTLEMQVLVPLQDGLEMDHNIVAVCHVLNQDSAYAHRFQEVFNDSVSPYTLVRAIANYERTIVSRDAPIDKYLNGSDALDRDALRGAKLYYGKAGCSSCHSGILFTDYGFYNNGTSIADNDPGRERHTQDPNDLHLFKTPTLRGLKYTAPYMHGGQLQTLHDVIDQYNQGGTGHDYTDPRIKPLNLNQKEKNQLISFLRSLSE